MEFKIMKLADNVNTTKIKLAQLRKELEETELFKQIKELEGELAQHQERMEIEEQRVVDFIVSNKLKEVEYNGLIFKVKDTSRDSVAIEDESIIPTEYWREKREIDKQKILKDYRELGIIIPGADIVRNPKYKLETKVVGLK